MPDIRRGTNNKRARLSPAKLTPPQLRVDLVSRPHLLERLDGMQSYAVALLRSPAGFGKTTLLSQWWQRVDKNRTRAAWLNLDKDDRDMAVFATSLAAALERTGLALGDLPHMVGVDMPLLEGFLFNAIFDAMEHDHCQDIVLVLEDYHLAGSGAVDHFVQRFIDAMPAKLHIVITSRSRPGFPLSKLRTFGRLLELDEGDLKFIDSEVNQFFGPEVPAEQVKDLNIRAQGWPVALQLARLWLQRGADPIALSRFSGSVHAMAAYLTDQIVADLPEDDRNFLIATSIVDTINGDLADALTGLGDGWDRLRMLHQIGVPMIPLTPEQDWFRYHPTLAEYLRGLAQRQGEQKVADLHRKASDWFARHDAILPAIHHAMEIGDLSHAVKLANGVSWVRCILSGDMQEAIRMKELLPLEEITRHPRLLLAVAYLLMKEGKIAEGDRLCRQAAALVEDGYVAHDASIMHGLRQDMDWVRALNAVYMDLNPSADLLKSTERLLQEASAVDYTYRGLINNILAMLYYRRGELINARAAGLNSFDEYSRSGMRYGGSFVLIHLAMFSITHGYLDDALAHLEKVRMVISRYVGNDPGLRLRAAVFEAEVLYERNKLEKANDLLFEALPEIETSEGWVELYTSAYRTAAFVAYAERGLEAALDALAPGFAIADKFNYGRLRANLTLKKIWLLIRHGRIQDARAIGHEVNLEKMLEANAGNPLSWREREEAAVTLAWLELSEGQAARADQWLKTVEDRCLKGMHRRRLIQVRILRALAALKQGDLAMSAHHLKLAIHDARQSRFLRLFLDFGEPMRDLLKKVVDHMGVAAIPETVLDWIAEVVSAFDSDGQSRDGDLGNLILTDRERDILAELKKGGSNKTLARRLDMTDNAVKFHLRNLYRKLGVNSRRMAAAVAEKRGL